MSGGGKPDKSKNLVNDEDILNALDKSFSDNLDSESETELPEKDNIPVHVKSKVNNLGSYECSEESIQENVMEVSEESSIDPCSESQVERNEISGEQYLSELKQKETFSKKESIGTEDNSFTRTSKYFRC